MTLGSAGSIGGKSLGGRVASLVADELRDEGAIAGLVCLGYPFHPPAKPENLRTAHLETLRCPTLIVQGERDPFGSRAEVESYPLSPAIRFVWAGDGDHDLGPRGGSGFTRKGNLALAADAVAEFTAVLTTELTTLEADATALPTAAGATGATVGATTAMLPVPAPLRPVVMIWVPLPSALMVLVLVLNPLTASV